MGILSFLLLTPLFGVFVLLFIPNRHILWLRLVANVLAFISLVLSLYLLWQFDSDDAGLQFVEYFPLDKRLGSSYALGVDGISLPMLLLATLLSCIALLASLNIKERVKTYHICLLLLEFGMLGVFLAQDWLLFYIFWEATLVPLFFLIDRWGGVRKHAASLNFVLYTMGGSVFMLISLLAINQHDAGHWLMSAMSAAVPQIPVDRQIWIFLGLLIGFGVKMPIFPLHGWLPLAHVEAPSPVSILLSGILLKMGAYGLIRTVVMMPEAAHTLQHVLLALALFAMVYGGLLAWRQSDLKAMIAYSSVSHLGLALLGIACLSDLGLKGAVLQMFAHGLIAGALFLLVGLLYERTHTRDIQDYRSLIQVMPRFALLMTFTLFAAMGLPSTVGFVAELEVLIAGFQLWGYWMVFLSISVLISAAYAMRTIGWLFTGSVNPAMQHIEDLKPFELVAALVLVIGIMGFGLLPNALINLSANTIEHLHHSMVKRFL